MVISPTSWKVASPSVGRCHCRPGASSTANSAKGNRSDLSGSVTVGSKATFPEVLPGVWGIAAAVVGIKVGKDGCRGSNVAVGMEIGTGVEAEVGVGATGVGVGCGI
jgi:hypothetical protein